MSFTLKVLPALSGDCIFITYKDNCNTTNILIDGGLSHFYPRVLKPYLKEIKKKKQHIDLLIVTHMDNDHIMGINKLFDDREQYGNGFVKEVWFNSKKLIEKDILGKEIVFSTKPVDTKCLEITWKEGLNLERKLEGIENCWRKSVIPEGFYHKLNGAEIDVISPSQQALEDLYRYGLKQEEKDKKKEEAKNKDNRLHIAAKGDDHNYSVEELINNSLIKDKNPYNISSIAFIFSLNNKRIMMLGDAEPSRITDYLKMKKEEKPEYDFHMDFIKLSHHGSKKNINPGLLQLVQCTNFIVSTNGSSHNHPDKECLARIAENRKDGVNFYFNYKNEHTTNIFTEKEINKYNITMHYLNQRSDYYIQV